MSMKLAELVGKIENKYGDGTIRLGSQGRTFQTVRFSTGIFDVDCAIGGGVPWGRFLRVFGPYSGGKSSLWLKTVASGQGYCRYCRDHMFPDYETGEVVCSCPRSCTDCETDYIKKAYKGPKQEDENGFAWDRIYDEWECKCLVNPPGTKAKKDRRPKVTRRCGVVRVVWVDAENCYDREWSRKLGVDNDLVFVVVPEYMQQAGDIVQSLLRSGEVDIFVVDSIAELVPAEEIQGSTEDYHVGLAARKFNQTMRKWGASIAKLGGDASMKPCVLLINQTRDSMGRGEVTPGGWQQYFKSSIDIRMGAAKYEIKETKQGSKKIEELLYMDTSGLVRKNKTHPPMKRFSYRFYVSNVGEFETGSTNDFGVIMMRAVDWEIILRPKKDRYVYTDNAGNEHVWRTQKAVMACMRDNVRLFWEIRDKLLDAVIRDAKGL